MDLKKYCIIALVAIMVMVLSVGSPITVAQESPPESSPGLHTGWMTELGGGNITYNRTYEYYIPTGYDGSEAVPLLFSFHGLGSSGTDQIDLTEFDALAEQEGFIAVFPDATVLDPESYPSCAEGLPDLPGAEIQWNMGAPGSLQYCAGIDDVGFVSDMVDWFENNYNIDESRIYATGMSNGAMFSYLLAFNLTGTFAGIAPVCSPMTLNLGGNTTPITVIVMMGTADPIVPYEGYGSLNVTYSTDETIAYWCGVDNTTTGPVTTAWGPTALDLTVVTRYVYSGGTDGTEVILFKVDGGGHTWPGGPLYSPFVGKVTNHIDGSALIWKHLPPEKYYLKISSTLGGSVTTPGEGTFFYDPDPTPIEVNLTAVPDNNCEFVNWTWILNEGSIENANAANTTITITPNEDYEITANFIALYDLTIDSTDGGEVTTPGEGTSTYYAGTVVDLVATPDAGYRFVYWTGDPGKIANRNAAETTIPMEGNYVITANFAEESEEPSGGCFIATATYGTPTAERLNVLREFRDVVLLESTVGSRLVDLYYQVSPPIADFISENNFVRTLVRELLVDPAVWLVEATGDIWRN